MTKKVDRRLQAAMQGAIGTRARKVERIPGFLGTFVDGVKTVRVPGRSDFVFVRLRMDQSEVIEAFNDKVGDQFGIPVTVIRDESAPRFYRIESREIDTYQDWGSPYLVNHAEQHMFAGGTGTVASDVVWVYRRAFVPLGVSPAGNMTANVASDYYIWDNTVKHFGPTGTVDFSNIRDSLGIFEARFVTVFLNGDTSELNYLTGEIFDNTVVVTDPTEFISVPGANEGIPLAAIYLFNSMTQVLWKDIFDIRQIIQSVGGSGGGSGVNWANVIIVAVSGGDHTTITAALAAASSGDIVLVMPGVYAEAITLVAGVTIAGLTNSTGPVIIAPAASSPVTIPSGAGTYRLHNCTLTPPSGTTCVDDNMGASGIAELYRVSIGSIGGGDSIDSSGGDAAALLTVEECRLAGAFTQFTPCDFIDSISTSAILPATSAGDLTIYGGEVGGNITHVSGQTISYLNNPFIGGAVTGSATEFGNYTDGVNDFEVTGDVVIQSGGGLYVPDLFDAGFNIPFVSTSSGLFSSSTQLLWTGVAVTITNEGASSPRGVHNIQYSDTASVAPQWTSSRAEGSLAFPSAVQSGSKLGEFRFRGFDTLFTDTVAEIQVNAVENFTTGSHGTEINFFTTPNTTTTLREVGGFSQAGQLAVTVTGSGAGIVLGGGAQWYDDSGTMRTPDALVVDGTGQVKGEMGLGVNDITGGVLNIYGNATGSNAGGSFRMYLAVDHDSNFQFYNWDAFTDDLRMFSQDAVLFNQFRYSEGTIFNEGGNATQDFRIEGDTLAYMFFTDATPTTENIALLTTAAPNWQSMDRGIFVGNVSTAPTGNPTSGGFLYSSAGAGTWRGSSGTVTTFGPAGEHCGACGYDFWRVHYVNSDWGALLKICEWCGAEHREGPKSVLHKLSDQERSELV